MSISQNKSSKIQKLPHFSKYVQREDILHRMEVFEKMKEKALGGFTSSISSNKKISVKIRMGTSGDFATAEGNIGEITPLKAAEKLPKSTVKKAFIAKVDGELFDLNRFLIKDCSVELLDFESEEGKHVFWHSSAHVLGQCIEAIYGGNLAVGPALEYSFYYDADIGESKVTEKEYEIIEKTFDAITSESQPFERVEITKAEAKEMFRNNKIKREIIEGIGEGVTTSAYRCGPLIDLCRGPHLPSTGYIKAFKVLKHSSCYWQGNSSNPSLQRIYGISFPNKKSLKKKLKEIELAKERDHRKIGKDLDLFFFKDISPGSAFWLPKGAKIYNTLIDFLRKEYRLRGYEEVITPNVYNMSLWDESGHSAKYKDNMFNFKIEKQDFAMKPMNCPGHCKIYKHKQKTISYKNLPIRYADFGVLHRNELTGTLSGLSRVRRFQQDDAHIFCMIEQIESEINGCLDFIREVYEIFGFEFSLLLSTRPEKFIGEIDVWDRAENALESCLKSFGRKWSLNKGDGAFYGPKIDILLHDALGRSIQCATVQLDFNLPSKERFDLKYLTKEGEEKHPVIIHRAILGSVERFIAVLIEHCGGKFPFWISPRQIKVIPVSEKFIEFGSKLQKRLIKEGFEAEIDCSDNTVPKKVRSASKLKFNVILVVGKKEVDTGVYTVKDRDNDEDEQLTFVKLVEKLRKMVDCKVK